MLSRHGAARLNVARRALFEQDLVEERPEPTAGRSAMKLFALPCEKSEKSEKSPIYRHLDWLNSLFSLNSQQSAVAEAQAAMEAPYPVDVQNGTADLVSATEAASAARFCLAAKTPRFAQTRRSFIDLPGFALPTPAVRTVVDRSTRGADIDAVTARVLRGSGLGDFETAA
jgi:hypothetical protein